MSSAALAETDTIPETRGAPDVSNMTDIAPTPGSDRTALGNTSQYISFMVRKEEYGVDIMAVREIKGWTDVTRLPNTPDYVRGVLNLRGVMVPIFDLSQRFRQAATDATNLHVVIIVSACDRILGILVDAVSDILTVSEEDVRPVPDMNMHPDEQLLNGLVTVGDRMVSLLDLEKLFNVKSLEEGLGMSLG